MNARERFIATKEGNMDYPRIYLAIDNCFASKRWTQPKEWMKVITDLGIAYIEASADTECDPLYMGSEYLSDWIDDVIEQSAYFGVKIANLYSGHGTYSTLGLSHTDERIRDRFLNEWLKPMAKNAAKLGSGLGFFCHAFPVSVLADPDLYSAAKQDLIKRLAELSVYCDENNCGPAGVEQMYTPHQIPWTIKGTREMIKDIYKISGKPFYITIDVGHQCGQRKFLKPEINQLEDKLLIDSYPYLFAEYDDGDPYNWLEQLGCYSPVVHLQQTDGMKSSHLPFTSKNNRKGIIKPKKVLEAIFESYNKADLDPNVKIGSDEMAMPEKCKDIYLTLEIFASTADKNGDLLDSLSESVKYWRKFIPEDGLTIDKLINP
ncbi:MAG: TIM barrel protein [Saccharofermentanales bacterium]